mmetsp:Transcript_11670/g.19712  ORF Transcript_11670/g.19712 Transcript_11670/m.19712 type:complete len:93 (+) Transcript_11670:1286-1564(+)
MMGERSQRVPIDQKCLIHEIDSHVRNLSVGQIPFSAETPSIPTTMQQLLEVRDSISIVGLDQVESILQDKHMMVNLLLNPGTRARARAPVTE